MVDARRKRRMSVHERAQGAEVQGGALAFFNLITSSGSVSLLSPVYNPCEVCCGDASLWLREERLTSCRVP